MKVSRWMNHIGGVTDMVDSIDVGRGFLVLGCRRCLKASSIDDWKEVNEHVECPSCGFQVSNVSMYIRCKEAGA